MKTNNVIQWFVINARNNRIVHDNVPTRKMARIMKNLFKLAYNDDYRIGKMVVAK